MTKSICAIDFGTSNSTIGIIDNNKPKLINIEDNKQTIPTAVFYDNDTLDTLYGRKAINAYKQHDNGRLLKSLKSVLGTSLMNDKTFIHGENKLFTDIILDFIKHLKHQAENIEQSNYDKVVIGRPINFIDDNEQQNQLAQDTLYNIAKQAGFKDISFQYEPIAASLQYEQSLTKAELVMIIDIGGGTTDISIIHLSPDFINLEDRTKHCLANTGVHIGGTDFDKNLSLQTTMPLLGYKQNLKNNLLTPNYLYHTIATWHSINTIYTKQFKQSVFNLKPLLDTSYYNRLNTLIDDYAGHELAFILEDSKIKLSDNDSIIQKLNCLEDNLSINIRKQDLDISIKEQLHNIELCINDCLSKAQLQKQDIDSIFLTGGSSQMLSIQSFVKSVFPNTKIDNTDTMASVGKGLILDAYKKFK